MWMQINISLTSADRSLHILLPLALIYPFGNSSGLLLAGSTEVITSLQDHKDPNLLLKLIDMHKITVFHFVPSMLNVF